MKKKILVSCFEVPGWGGASTSAYELFANILNDGYDASFINLISAEDEELFKSLFNGTLGNPRHLPNVYNHILSLPQFGFQNELAAFIKNISPDVILAVGWIAALVLKKAAPEKKVIYLTTGSNQVKSYIRDNMLDSYLYLDKYIRKNGIRLKALSKEESEAVISADLIITHSEMMQDVYKYFYRAIQGKILSETIWFAEWIYKDAANYRHLGREFFEREIDVVFIANDWTRPEKNYNMVKKIVKHFTNLNIYIIGNAEEKCNGAKYTGAIAERNKLFELLGNSKTVVCPSVFDSAPGILFEASALGCNVVASKNCGNWQLCNEKLLVEPFNMKTFRDKISESLKRKYDDNINYFLQTNSYKKLIETVNLF